MACVTLVAEIGQGQAPIMIVTLHFDRMQCETNTFFGTSVDSKLQCW